MQTMIDPDLSQVVELARAGDQDALAELFRECRSQIEAIGYETFGRPGSRENVEDFCSDVWLLALKYLGSFRGECKFSTWLVRIGRHKALAILQRRAQPKNGDSRLVYQGNGMPNELWESECSAPEDRRLRAATARSDARRLMKTLTPGHRELVQLHHLDGFTETEIAKKTGLSVPAVRGRLSRAMVQLRKKVGKGAYRNGTEFSLTK